MSLTQITRLSRSLLTTTLLAAAVAAFTTACANDVEDGADLIEPEDTRDNEDLQGLYDCTERGDTGYRQGDDFAIRVVSVDGRAVEVRTANAYVAMQRAAANAGVSVRIVSGFRTQSQQQYLYGCYTNCNCNSCNLAARPGYSNHQSGHALDLNTSDAGVLSWLNNHGAQFGFRRTVPSEAWHWEWWGNASDFDGPCGLDNGSNNPGGGNNNGDGSAAANTCEALPALGGTVDDGDDCFEAGGPSQYLRAMDEGHDGDCVWTGATANANAANYAVWNLRLAEAGEYAVEVYVQGSLATTERARYTITHAGVTNNVLLSQRGGNRWIPIGTWSFNAGAGQRIRLNDNTGESASTGKKIVFDAVRLTRVTPQPPASCPYLEVDTSGGPLNVRRTPDTANDPVGAVADGSVIRRIETVQGQAVSGTRDWHRIEGNNVVGYVSAAFTLCRDNP